MNERIRELALQVDLMRYPSDGINIKIEKFAELIVRECIAEAVEEVAFRGGSVGIEAGIRLRLQQHFGVEE